MIINEITYTCPRCESTELVKNGKNAYGNQQFRCKSCGKTGVLNPKNRRSEAEIEQILAAYRERPSMRGIARIFGISRNTLSKWLKKSQETTATQSHSLTSQS
jgi:transposase-like protein